jgi:DNA replication and repair protein RecF
LVIEHVVMQDFRNLERVQVELAPALNLVVGRNAQGKTNLLEGLYCLGGLGSPRGPDTNLIRTGAQRALVHARIKRGERDLEVDLEVSAGRNRALVNKTPLRSQSALTEIVVAVFFGPDELSLVKGSPEGRRRFLDDLVVKLRPAREGLRRELERVLRQRNALLRSGPRRPGVQPLPTLDVWDEALARVGSALTAARFETLARVGPAAQSRWQQIAGGGSLETGYSSSWIGGGDPQTTGSLDVPEDAFVDALMSSLGEARARELERGMSLVGPQRDDIAVRVSSSNEPPKDARSLASQGEQRTAALALKLGEYDTLCQTLGVRPVLLLDDVFSELDPDRRSWLGRAVRSAGQVILSSAEPGAPEAARADRVIEVIRGEVSVRG